MLVPEIAECVWLHSQPARLIRVCFMDVLQITLTLSFPTIESEREGEKDGIERGEALGQEAWM